MGYIGRMENEMEAIGIFGNILAHIGRMENKFGNHRGYRDYTRLIEGDRECIVASNGSVGVAFL